MKRKNKIIAGVTTVLVLALTVNIMAGAGSFRNKISDEDQARSATVTGTGDNITKLTINAHDGMAISSAAFQLDKPKAVVQIVHGATEHKELYYDFAEFLHNHGYAVIISDHRGHGETLNVTYPYGHMNGVDEMIDDLYRVTEYAQEMYPDTPVYMLGHSLGLVLVRNYLQEHDNEIDKLVMTGTANYIKNVNLGIFIGNWATFYSGAYGHSTLLDRIGGSTLYGELSYEDNWVTTDKEMYAELSADPLMKFAWTNSGALTVFEADSNMKKYDKYKLRNPDLEILSLTGTEDPITGGEEGLADTEDTLKKIGYSQITMKQYQGKLHAVLFETNRASVYSEVLQFFEE